MTATALRDRLTASIELPTDIIDLMAELEMAEIELRYARQHVLEMWQFKHPVSHAILQSAEAAADKISTIMAAYRNPTPMER